VNEKKLYSRRSILKLLGVSTAGISLATAASLGKEKIQSGSDEAKKEIDQLKKSFEELDARSKLIMRTILFLTGLDFFL
jgi:hypothetical protein